MSGGIALAFIWACQTSPLVEEAGGFRHRDRGWSVAAPPAGPGEAGWRRISVQGSSLAYRRVGPAGWMSLSSRCGEVLAPARTLARHLRIGIGEHTVRQSTQAFAGALEGWQQVLDVRAQGSTVRLKTVTFVVEPCALDWVLSVPDGRGFEAAERDFDTWWQSLSVADVGQEVQP